MNKGMKTSGQGGKLPAAHCWQVKMCKGQGVNRVVCRGIGAARGRVRRVVWSARARALLLNKDLWGEERGQRRERERAWLANTCGGVAERNAAGDDYSWFLLKCRI